MTRLLPPDAAGIAEAAALLRAGELVAFPTETVYGLGADATNGKAVAAIFAAKGRPLFNPLIIHYASAEAAFADAMPTPLAVQLAEKFWPGPLTLVLARRGECRIADLASADLPSLAVRVPAHPIALALLRAAAIPLAGPSANRSGRVSPTRAAHVLEELEGRIAAVLDGGDCPVGVESTVLDLTPTAADLNGRFPRLLRPGGVTAEALAPFTGGALVTVGIDNKGGLLGPGMLASHYAPSLPLRLHAHDIGPDEALLAFGPALPGAKLVYQLSATRDLGHAAAHLFEGLRWLDHEAARAGLKGLAAMPIPEEGLGLAINDRLMRAAHLPTIPIFPPPHLA